MLSLQPAGVSAKQSSSKSRPASQLPHGPPPAPSRAPAGGTGPRPRIGAWCPRQPPPGHFWHQRQQSPEHLAVHQAVPPQHSRPGGSSRSTSRDPASARMDSPDSSGNQTPAAIGPHHSNRPSCFSPGASRLPRQHTSTPASYVPHSRPPHQNRNPTRAPGPSRPVRRPGGGGGWGCHTLVFVF